LNSFVWIWKFFFLELEVSHPFLPVIVEEEVSVGVILLALLLGTHDLLDVPLQSFVRKGFIRWNLNKNEIKEPPMKSTLIIPNYEKLERRSNQHSLDV
jgi:hypothetical protein